MSKARGRLNRFAGPHIVQPVDRPRISPMSLKTGSQMECGYVQSLEFEATGDNEIIKQHQPIKTPWSEMDCSRPLLHSISSTSFELEAILVFDANSLLMERQNAKLPDLFRSKCR